MHIKLALLFASMAYTINPVLAATKVMFLGDSITGSPVSITSTWEQGLCANVQHLKGLLEGSALDATRKCRENKRGYGWYVHRLTIYPTDQYSLNT
jgi:hypothetical protein